MTNQEIFDRVAAHLLTQNAQSMNGSQCAYRGSNGMKCAIGCLIPDKHYSPKLEGKSVHRDSVCNALAKSIGDVSNYTKRLLSNLQRIHDTKSPEYWKYLLKEVTYDYNLSGKILDEL